MLERFKIVRIHAHAGGKNDHIASLIDQGANNAADHTRIIGDQDALLYAAAQRVHLARQYRGKAIGNKPMADLGPGNDQACPKALKPKADPLKHRSLISVIS